MTEQERKAKELSDKISNISKYKTGSSPVKKDINLNYIQKLQEKSVPEKEIIADTAQQIANKLNSIPGALTKEVIRDLPTAKDVVEEIRNLKGNDRIDISHIRNGENIARIAQRQNVDMNDQRFHGSGITALTAGTGITITDTTGGGKTISTTDGAGTAGSDVDVGSSGATYTKMSTAVASAPSSGWTIYEADGTITETTKISPLRSSTKMNLSGGAVITNNGATLTTLFSTTTPGSFGRTEIHGGKLLQSNATAQGVALDLSDMPNTWAGNMRIEAYGTALQIIDTTNTSFYSSVRDMQVFDCVNGISLGGTQPNLNLWENIRIRTKAGTAGTGVNMVDTRGNVFIMVDTEPNVAAGLTGFHLDGTTRDNLFLGCWMENSDNGLIIDAGANNNVFIGGSITSNLVADITDNGTNTVFWGVNKTGTKLYRVPRLTDVNGLSTLTFTETALAVNNFNIANSATATPLVLSAVGTDTNIDILFTPKGTLGTVNFSAAATPVTNDGAALGNTTLQWSDLFLASGGVINFNNGDVTITHSADLLTIGGGGLKINGDLAFGSGSKIKTSTSAGNTFLITARDVDGASDTTFITLTANNTPTCDLSTAVTVGGYPVGIAKRFVTVTQSATPAINTDTTDIASITALAQAITSFTTNLTGTPVAGQYLMVQITDNGTARALTWGAKFASTTVLLPSTTTISTLLRVGFQWDTVAAVWQCIAVA